jgi:hypothetical protein
MITQITTHSQDAIKRLLYQYQDKENLNLFIDAIFASQVQKIEDAAFPLFTRLDVANSEGEQLDSLGAIVGQARMGLDDSLYRIWIKAKIGANVSEGNIEMIIALWKLFVPEVTKVQIQEFYPAEILLYSNVAPIAVYENQIVDAMQRSVCAGVKFGWALLFDSLNAFQFAGAAGGGGFGDLNNPNIGGELSYII